MLAALDVNFDSNAAERVIISPAKCDPVSGSSYEGVSKFQPHLGLHQAERLSLVRNRVKSSKRSTEIVNNVMRKHKVKNDFSDFSPDQDLFDDTGFIEASDHDALNHLKSHENGRSLNDSLSEIFFRTVNDDVAKHKNDHVHVGLNDANLLQKNHGAREKDKFSVTSNICNEKRQNCENSDEMSTPKIPKIALQISSGVSLKDRLKQRLQVNIGVSSGTKKIEDDIREGAIVQAHLDASQIRKEGTTIDIGPFHGLPAEMRHLLQTTRGIFKLYEWQEECLQLQALRERKNLIYSLPTSGGKTLVAEVLIMRELLCYKRDALFILPFVSIVQEKVRSIAEFATKLGFIIEEYAGSKGRFPPIRRREKRSLYIATIEKAHSLVNSLIENDLLNGLGLIVVDELHMIGEGGSRGANLEALLLKTLVSESETQIIGMSATLNNIKDLQKFLHAEVYSNEFRPV
ncbi:helicase polq-like protein [Plakobranchus ocellatus]|uniref:Helicase polq-like protein n=1 Tax=Plakobranchus ocellatus TaxID=259542 RepID=A0AAV4BW28_9GAST|nr:helicase polq-like protein [Plakobranchus ocellatus]